LSHYLGGLFRMADALGVEKIYLSSTTPVPPGKKISRTARSTVKVVAYEYRKNPLEVVATLREAGYKIVSLEITKQSIDVTKFEVAESDKICLVIGSEGWGVRHDLLNASDAAVHIQMRSVNSSMNVTVATSIAVFELTKRLMS